ncbi:MAG: hypothetical protein KKE17_14755 [Proteobacteria bacterium]|nr:hypothetical protein [Pseudomonadota bacterium]
MIFTRKFTTSLAQKVLFSLIVFSTFLPVSPLYAIPINFSGYHNYSEDQDGNSSEQLRQYWGLSLKHELTEAMTLSEGVRYYRNWRQGAGTDETIAPNMTFLVQNDIFRYHLDAYQSTNRNTQGDESSTFSWNTSWGSQWQNNIFVPTLTLNYGEDQSTSKSIHGGASSGIDLKHATASLAYSFTETGENIINRNDSYSAKIQSNKNFFADALRLSYSQVYTENYTTLEIPGSPSGQVTLPVNIVQALSGIPATPLIGSLTDTPGLINNDVDSIVVSVSAGQEMNFGFKNATGRVDMIFLYTDIDIGSDAGSFSLDVYYSNDGSFWTKEGSTLAFLPYNSLDRRFEITVPAITADYVKVVTRHSLLLSTVNFTEIQANYIWDRPEGTFSDKRKNTTGSTNCNIGYYPSKAFSAVYSLFYSIQNNPIQGESQTLNQSGNIRWFKNKYMNTSFQFGESSKDYEQKETQKTRFYGIDFSSSPIKTVGLSIGADQVEGYNGTDKVSTTNNYLFSTRAALYRDLDASYTFRYNKFIENITNSTSGNKVNQLDFTARLFPEITSSFTVRITEYLYGSQEADEQLLALSASWRISDELNVNSSITSLTVGDNSDYYNFIVSADYSPVRDIKMTLSYTLSESEQTTQNYLSNVNWAITKHLNWRLNALYTDTTNSYNYNFNSQININF